MGRPFGVPAAASPRNLLHAKRLAAGLTIQALSGQTGVPINTICQLERGNRIPTGHLSWQVQRELAALAFALHVEPPEALLDGVDADDEATPAEHNA